MDFERFYMTHYHEALKYTIKRIGNQHDAEDVLSETFLYCYDHSSEYDPRLASERTWLYLVLKSRIQNHFRNRREEEQLEITDTLEYDGRNYMDDAAELEETRNALAAALLSLPERQRKLVILRYFYECNTKELAEQTGMSAGNARTTLSRALNALGRILELKGFGKE